MGELKGDYIGFTFNGVHSSDLGIVRVSNGSRFDENLLPTIKDKTVEVSGRDGAYYFGSQYTQR
jgi:phage-related protein